MGYNVFLATPKGMDDEMVQAYFDRATERFVTALEGIELSITKAEDDYREHFARCGGWAEWTRDVGRGVDYLYRTPRYNCILCVTELVGKATADIVRNALEGERMVLLMDDVNGPTRRVADVAEIDPQDYRSGWRLVLERQ